MSTLILSETGHIEIAKLFKGKNYFLAWGTNPNGDWGKNPDPVNTSHTQLLNEIGRRKILVQEFVTPSPTGEIETTIGYFAISKTPTKYVYFRCNFSFTDAPDSNIAQFGLFSDTVPKDEFKELNYLTPAQIQDKGNLLALENCATIYRSESVKEVHEMILTF